MIELGENQIEALQLDRQQRLEGRLDHWLASHFAAWADIVPSVRLERLKWIVQQGKAHQMESEADFAMFAALFAALGDSAVVFAAHPDVLAVINWDSARPGARLQELHLLADQIFATVAV